MVAVHGLQLHDHGSLAVEQGQHVHEFGDGLIGAFQAVVFQVFGGQVFNAAGAAGGAVQEGVVDDRQVAVLQQVDVQLDAVAAVQCGLEGSHAVFRQAIAVEAPMGVRPALQVLQPRIAAAAVGGDEQERDEEDEKF